MKEFNEDQSPAVIDRTMMETAISRAAQEVQAAMVIAKKFPRDENAAYAKIMKACARNGLAEVACYAYPRGGTTVTGPSIRLAETLKMAWGNVESGIVELEQKNGESIVMSYAWDLETNSKETKIFTVKHERHTRQGVTKLTDPRDIYELVANQGARRLRACILAVIPGDVVDAAVEACDKTLKGDGKEPLADRAKKMIVAFDGYGVTLPMIEQRLGHKIDALIEQELVNLRKIFNALKDGAAKREDFFQFADKPAGDAPKFVPKTEPKAEKPADKRPTDKPKKEPAPPVERATPLQGLRNLSASAQITDAQLLAFFASQGVFVDSLEDVEEAAISAVINSWVELLPKVRGETDLHSTPHTTLPEREIPVDTGELIQYVKDECVRRDIDESALLGWAKAPPRKWAGAASKISEMGNTGLGKLARALDQAVAEIGG